MSLILEFLSVGGVAPDLQALDDWFREVPGFREAAEQDGARTWWYQSDTTGVYFSVSYRFVEPLDEDLWAPTGLEALVNHLRPEYFAREAAPILAGLAREFEWMPRDGETGQVLSLDPEADAIVGLWKQGNRHVREDTLSTGKKIHHVSLEANIQWWEYARRRHALKELLAKEDPNIAVPEMHFLHSRPLDRILTAFSWENEGGTVFPASDIVVLDRTESRMFGLRKERKLAYVAYDALLRQIVGALKTVEVDGMAFRVLTRENAWRAVERLPMLTLNEELDVFQAIPSVRVADADA